MQRLIDAANMQNKKTVRWAILGPGKIAHKFAQDFQQTTGGELVAVASRDKERAARFASQYDIKQVLSYDELYVHPDIDAVYVATPHAFHFEQTKACLQHGKGVLCEKPVTINDTQLRELIAIAQSQQVFLMEGLWSFFMPALQQAKAWVDEGRIGDVKMITADFGYRMAFDPENRIYNAHLAGGALLDLGIYPIAFSTYVMNAKPDRIAANAIMSETHIDETTAISLFYGKTTAVLHTTVLANTLNTGYIIGEAGYIELPFFYKASSCTLYNQERMELDSFEASRPTYGYDYEIQEATNCIREGKTESPVVPHQRSLEIQAIMTEVRRQIGLIYPMEK